MAVASCACMYVKAARVAAWKGGCGTKALENEMEWGTEIRQR